MKEDKNKQPLIRATLRASGLVTLYDRQRALVYALRHSKSMLMTYGELIRFALDELERQSGEKFLKEEKNESQ